MKKRFSFILAVWMLVFCLCSCTSDKNAEKTDSTQQADIVEYQAIKQLDPYVVEPDDNVNMSDEDRQHYRSLMDALLSQQQSITLSDNKAKNEYYIDLLKQSPYYFFAKSCEICDDTIVIEYAYSLIEQMQMQEFMDEKLLLIANSQITAEDNELDIILKIHSEVSKAFVYDHDRTDNKQLGSPLFNYPSDEIYKSLKSGKSLCYGFAYTFRFALLQHGIDCFCVYGPCSYRDEAHMWNIFKYDGKFYTCDPAWDRSEEEYARLFHFGKTDDERISDGLEKREYSSKFFDIYGQINCVDERFKIFRGITRYSFTNDHTYYMVDFEGNELLFDSETLEIR